MSKLTVQAKTVEEAIQSALQDLQRSEDQVEIRIVQEPSRGFLGLGHKPAVVEVEPLADQDEAAVQNKRSSDALETAQQFLGNVLRRMELDVAIHVHNREDHVVFDISGSGLGMIIGRRGQTLDALQYLTNVVANRYTEEYMRIVLDAENYRERRRETLQNLADRLAQKAIRTHQKVVLEPMNPAERKIIHTHLQDYSGVTTKSEGQEPNRRIVLYPK